MLVVLMSCLVISRLQVNRLVRHRRVQLLDACLLAVVQLPQIVLAAFELQLSDLEQVLLSRGLGLVQVLLRRRRIYARLHIHHQIPLIL